MKSMSKNVDLKKQVVSEITGKIRNAKSIIVVHYNGITVEDVTALRNQFRAAGVEYVVYKNTLVQRALKDLHIDGFDSVLQGPSAFAFGMKDPVAPAKVITEYISKSKKRHAEGQSRYYRRKIYRCNRSFRIG